jgi:glutathione S-transferase
MIRLYQFPFSHFCEKARWALDYKRIAYQPVNLLPGLHVKRVRKLAPKSCLPVLQDGDVVVQDSAAIITHLDAKYPHSSLTPHDPEGAREASEWEKTLDERIGVPLRLWFYYHMLLDRPRALDFLLTGAPWYGRPLFKLIFPKVREAMVRAMKINTQTAQQAEQTLLAAVEKLDAALTQRRFLVADRFSRADLTACALLSPCCLSADLEAPAKFPLPVLELRSKLKKHRSFHWVQEVYREFRKPAPMESIFKRSGHRFAIRKCDNSRI